MFEELDQKIEHAVAREGGWRLPAVLKEAFKGRYRHSLGWKSILQDPFL